MNAGRRTHLLARVGLAALAVLFVPSGALAQGAPEPDEPAADRTEPRAEGEDGSFSARPLGEMREQDTPVPERARDTRDPAALLERNAVDALYRLALRRLRTGGDDPTRTGEASAREYRRAALCMSVLQRRTPEDDERLRMILDAWTWAGEESRAHEVLKRLVRLAPDDTVHQLRLIEHAIQRKQDADARIKLYERLLDSASNRLSDPVKSRLSLDAALLYREMGDEARYVSALGYATELDRTNKEAAALYATYFLDRTSDPLERLEVLVNVVIADPHDANAHLNAAHELMNRGAWEGAQRFLQNVNRLYSARGESLGPRDLFDIALTIWNAEGAEEAVAFVKGLYEREILAEQQRREAMLERGQTPQERPVLLPEQIEMIRLAIFTARGESDKALESMKRISDRHQIQLNVIRDPETRPPWIDEVRAVEVEQDHLLRRIAARLWSGQQLELAEIDLTTLRELGSEREVSDEALRRFDGLFAAQRGEYGRARELLEPLAEEDELARLGLGIVAQRTGETNEAIRHYAHVALMKPNSVIGSAARLSIELIRGEEIAPTPRVEKLNDYALSLGTWIDDVVSDPYNFMQISISHNDPSIDPLDRMEMELSLTNVSQHPIAVGPNAPIQSRVLLSPAVRIDGRPITREVVPEVISLDRRFRLMRGESITIPVWSGRGWIGAMNDFAVESGFSIRWRAIQNFMPTENGGYDIGPLAVTTRSGLMRRSALPLEGTTEELAESVRTTDGIALMQRILHLVSKVISVPRDASDEQRESVRATLGGALLDRMETMSPLQRAFAIAKAHRAGRLFADPQRKSRLIEIVGDDESPIVRLAMLMTVITPGDESYLARIESGDDPVLAELAAILRGGDTPNESTDGG